MRARLIHRFDYRYTKPVMLGPHRFCLRPRPHGFQRLIDFRLEISPDPSQLYELMAAGGDTIKLKYGHRSQNQPVQDLLTRRCYVTSQNHGYVVNEGSLPAEWEPWFVNVNDGSNEGIRCRTRPWSSVQFHPEAAPGPEDAAFLFDDFLRLVGSIRV